MKNLIAKMKNLITIIVFFFIFFLFLECSGVPQLNPEVFEVGGLICEVGYGLCDTGTIPAPVCAYLNIACVNLNLLCTEPPGSVKYEKAKEDLKNAKVDLSIWLKAYKKNNPVKSDSTGN